MTHGRIAEGERVVAHIESMSPACAAPVAGRFSLLQRRVGLRDVARTLIRTYPQRSLYALVLMTSQAFFYNAIFFTYALVLGRFFAVPAERIGLYLLPFAAGNFLGPLLLGRFVRRGRAARDDRHHLRRVGRAARGHGMVVAAGYLNATGQTLAWSVVFFFASAAASSA